MSDIFTFRNYKEEPSKRYSHGENRAEITVAGTDHLVADLCMEDRSAIDYYSILYAVNEAVAPRIAELEARIAVLEQNGDEDES